MNNGPTAEAERSSFVTGVAWTFIALAGFATLIALLQNIMLSVMMPAEEMQKTMRGAEQAQNIPAFARFMFDNFRLVFASFLILSAVTLVSAIGLLKRKNWARLTFIGIMGVGVLWNVAGVVLPFLIFSSFTMPEGAPADFRGQHDLMMKVMTAFTILIAVAFAGLFVWIIKRLVSNDIKREFVAL
jgi:NADH:ubiquinone oxidoreductase subunit 6 (subunit J)